MTIEPFPVAAEIGCVAIENRGVRFFFPNGYGDGFHECHIGSDDHSTTGLKFVGSFEVAPDSDVWLLSHDCGGATSQRLFRFAEGRWFAYNDGQGTVTINYCDDCTDLIPGGA